MTNALPSVTSLDVLHYLDYAVAAVVNQRRRAYRTIKESRTGNFDFGVLSEFKRLHCGCNEKQSSSSNMSREMKVGFHSAQRIEEANKSSSSRGGTK